MMRVSAWTVVVLACSACAPKPLRVGVVFDTSWRLPGTTLSESEMSLVRTTALTALRSAFEGFDVTVAEGARGDRLVRIEDAPPTPYRPGNPVYPGAVGLTLPLVTTSRVRVDALYSIELAVTHCGTSCGLTREQLLRGLGHGVGATAAHELGHQVGLEFTTDVDCVDCYDGGVADSEAHFFGVEHWSPKALAVMERVLPKR